MPGVPIYICIYTRTTIRTYGTRARTIGAPQHDTKHTMDTSCGTPWNTSTTDVPPGTIHPHLSRCFCVVHGTRVRVFFPASSTLSSLSLLFSSRLSSTSVFLFSRDILLFRILLRVIGSKVSRSKVIFSFRSLPLVPRERSVPCLSFFSFQHDVFFTLYSLFLSHFFFVSVRTLSLSFALISRK